MKGKFILVIRAKALPRSPKHVMHCCIILLYLHRVGQASELIMLLRAVAQTSLKNEVWQSLSSNCISIATFCSLPSTSVEVMLARAAPLALALLSYLCPASYPLSGKSNTLNGEGEHYDCNRNLERDKCVTNRHLPASRCCSGKNLFTITPVSAVFMISLECLDDTVLHALNVFNDLQAHETVSKLNFTNAQQAKLDRKSVV